MNEEEVLAWLVRQVSADEIEDVTDEMLDKIIERNPYVAAVFCEWIVRELAFRVFRKFRDRRRTMQS